MRVFAAAFAVVASLAACVSGVDRVTGTQAFTGSGTAIVPSGSRDPALVGTWNRTTFFQDDDGSFHSSELIWEFSADGGARRIIITSNLTLGLVATEVVQGLWRTSRGVLDVTILTPNTSTLRFQYSTTLSQLRLGPLVLERVS